MSSVCISIIIPVRNEEKHIRSCLSDVLAFELPPQVDYEVLVMDGRSVDLTRAIVDEVTLVNRRVQLYDNPGRTAPSALNRGLREAKGQWIMRLDAHSRYPKEYLRKCYETALRTKADNVGGIRETHYGRSLWSLAVALMINHTFAAGNAHYRTGAKVAREVDTVFCGFYRREIFESVGVFNEKLIRAQDKEFNARLRKNGGRIWLNPEITCSYYPRTNIAAYIHWCYLGGLWVVRAQHLSGTRLLSWRNFIPATFVSYQLVAVSLLSFTSDYSVAVLSGLIAYLLIAFCVSIQAAAMHKQWLLIGILPPLFYVTHMAYGVGFMQALLELLAKSTKHVVGKVPIRKLVLYKSG